MGQVTALKAQGFTLWIKDCEALEDREMTEVVVVRHYSCSLQPCRFT